jgi:protein-disulfide isomerase
MIRRDFIAAFLLAAGAAGTAFAQAATDEALGEMVLGKDDAPITMFAYENFMCSHCAAFHAQTLPVLKERYVDKGFVKIFFRELPGARDNPWPAVPALMARCFGKERYHMVADLLYREQEKWMKAQTGQQLLDNIFSYGRLAGMTRPQFDACVQNQEALKAMGARWREGSEKHGFKGGTPYFYVAGQSINGNLPIEAFEKVLKPLVEKLPKSN